MIHKPMHKLPTDALVDSFARAAVARFEAFETSTARVANRHFKLMTDIYRELKSRGLEAQRALLPLLNHAEPAARLGAAWLALDFAPTLGEPALRALKALHGLIGHEAGATLEEWKKGSLRFP
jgi:hypothetical protein